MYKIVNIVLYNIYNVSRKQTYRTKATPYLHDGLLYFLTHLERSEDEHIYICIQNNY